MFDVSRTERPAFLGVERSLTGKRWATRLGDERQALAIAQRHGLPDAICRLLAARDVGLDSVGDFLEPTLRKFLPDPSHLKDMDVAVDRLVRAVQTGERIVVFGDYDVDGATSSALLLRFFRAIGGNIGVYIPDRRKEGYGPNAPALLKIREEGASIVVTVDCGITAFEPLAEARRVGLDLIVIDHHMAEIALPDAVAVVDPNRLDDDSPHKHLAAVGVAFLLCVGVNRALRRADWYGTSRPEPDLRQWLDLVALGTVCDVVPLLGVNRALVKAGLQVMAQRGNAGLSALADVARMKEAPEAYHLGFLLGPRVNAGGRVGQADLGARLLSSDDPHEVGALAVRLDEFNAERRAIERDVLDQAITRIEGLYGPDSKNLPSVLVVESEGWHVGVIGIVASRLVERYARPAFVIGMDGALGKGSGRSVRGVDLGAAVIAARQAGLLVNGGGHAMAAGLTVARDWLPELNRFLDERIAPQLGAAPPVRELGIDAALAPAAATAELVSMIERAGPFGAGNAQPRFALTGVRVSYAQPVGEGHVRCTLVGAERGRVDAIAFRAAQSALGPALLDSARPVLHVAGALRIDRFGGRETVRLQIDDAATTAGSVLA
ncbi:single-stranded-DNA-specific exonuclease RecJ [Reyranella sp.]|jgi:single-stranded-DNA-specific exonuclease|uniref:single-stranded-DNA-specific exonuclease RecJ n=1 Tax=Reyranella sp. TaxID=1929291 RepID=UPI000BC96A86|nr:single-stranded-DNA-specific exonuclease RecJ [Reyranella sp.]OYY44163.1 MAG: single-stranded-DNA-specific exonuclease RecJ [Rhodospirillales bacterium 35-66-84]OYZ94839.1 MAG: single-stranded-DNA-specific exonuclease RecJ [Rhodospirillales bacterium 24-66-33]OZB26086.1 MAG: single-stranded-DNA-specific exonuclease RecJ [Rhodospirillales bacterium 39-66-50]HQS15218.1 single-stranded-DNA-specific exonuclease RecJ [Reyranella sp.]HQT11027.1 single-stranded-DNA-specific exonuclease RecJ [Reyra